jgi:DNA-binding transcriptional regulator YhcF (GntR family)
MATIETFGSHAYVYEQVADTIAERIQTGQITGKLPAEREIAHELGVSYQTLRRATSLLRARGLLVTRNGRGSFATPPSEPETGQLVTDQVDTNPRDCQAKDRISTIMARSNLTITIREQALENRYENLITASHILIAIASTPAGMRAMAAALKDVFPWVSHLSTGECSEFAAELIAALSDSAELAIDGNAPEVIAGWRATARVKADPSLHAQALNLTGGDHGPVEVLG